MNGRKKELLFSLSSHQSSVYVYNELGVPTETRVSDLWDQKDRQGNQGSSE